MDYLMWQLWLCLLTAFVLGAALGWLLRGNGKKKRAEIMQDHVQQLQRLQKERDEWASKASHNDRLRTENQSLLSRLSSMESGANLASSVLKENKAKLDQVEHKLLEMRQLIKRSDNHSYTEMVALLALKDEENKELRVELHDLLDKLEATEKKSIEIETACADEIKLMDSLLEAHQEGNSDLSKN